MAVYFLYIIVKKSVIMSEAFLVDVSILFSAKFNIVAIKHIYIFMLNDYLGENKTYLYCKNHLK